MKAAAQIVARAIHHLLRELQAIGLDALTIHNGQNYCSIYDLFSNPKGIGSISPGLRGTSYPGGKTESVQTLKGLYLFHKALICNPFRVGTFPRGNPA